MIESKGKLRMNNVVDICQCSVWHNKNFLLERILCFRGTMGRQGCIFRREAERGRNSLTPTLARKWARSDQQEIPAWTCDLKGTRQRWSDSQSSDPNSRPPCCHNMLTDVPNGSHPPQISLHNNRTNLLRGQIQLPAYTECRLGSPTCTGCNPSP